MKIENDNGRSTSSILVNIDVPDIKQATQFYVEAFSLKVGRRFGEDFIELLGFPSPLYLLKKKEGSLPFQKAQTSRTYERHWTPVHLDIAVESIELAVEKAKSAGAKMESEIRTAAWGKIAMFSDPFGNGFCLIQFMGKGYDEIASRPG